MLTKKAKATMSESKVLAEQKDTPEELVQRVISFVLALGGPEILTHDAKVLRTLMSRGDVVLFPRPQTLCVECGPDVRIDEWGCCQLCGRDAVGAWLEGR